MKSIHHHRIATQIAMAALCACFTVLLPSQALAQKAHASSMSGMGQLAHRRMLLQARATAGTNTLVHAFNGADNAGTGDLGDEDAGDAPSGGDPQDDDTPNIAGGQAETSVNCDSTGQHIVVGFNDTRGFAFAQTDVSGFMYSDDGGVTWTDGGQLPI